MGRVLFKMSKPEKVTPEIHYMYHPESDCLWVEKGPLPDSVGDGLVQEITEKEYYKLKEKINKEITCSQNKKK